MQVLCCLFAVLLASCVVLADDKDKDAKPKDDDRPKIFKRLIPADVLRGKDHSHIGTVVSGISVTLFDSLVKKYKFPILSNNFALSTFENRIPKSYIFLRVVMYVICVKKGGLDFRLNFITRIL